MHRSGAGVVRRTSKHRLQACLPDNALDYTHRHAQVIKDRSLFDMKLDVTEHARSDLGFVAAVGVQTKIANCLSHRDSAIILNLECISVQRADECPAAQKGNMEADALFFGKRDNLDAELRRFTIESFDKTNREHHAEHAIERACSGNRIDMRAYQQWRCAGTRSRNHAPNVSHRIDRHRQSRAFHPSSNQALRFAHRRRQERACRSIIFFTQLCQPETTVYRLASSIERTFHVHSCYSNSPPRRGVHYVEKGPVSGLARIKTEPNLLKGDWPL